MSDGTPPAISRYAHAVGRAAAPRFLDVEAGHVQRFAEAAGDSFDYVAAGTTPPTFAAALRPHDPRQGLEIDWTKLLHVEEEIVSHRPLAIGERVRVEAAIADARVKKGKSGTLDFLTTEARGYDVTDQLVFTVRATVAIRQ